MKTIVRSLAAAALAVSAATAAQAQTREINFGIISTESSQNLKTIWQPFLTDMEKAIGLKVNAFYASDYAGVIEGMRFGKVDVAWYGNKSAMEAVDRAGGEVFAQSVDSDGNPGYWSVVVTNVDSPLNNIDDLLKCDKSLSFGIGDPNSTSGFLVPSTFIFAQRGVEPRTCFKTVRNANHEANAMAAANKQVDAAMNNTENMRRLEVTSPQAFSRLKVIWKSPLIPSDPLVWKKDLDAAVKARLYTFIMTYGRQGSDDEVSRQRDVLKALNWAPFRPSSDAQLYPIRIMELTKEIFRVEADSRMAADEKAKTIEKMKAERAALEKQMAKNPQA